MISFENSVDFVVALWHYEAHIRNPDSEHTFQNLKRENLNEAIKVDEIAIQQ